MIHVVLFQPEIPQNTGNVGRMCALSGSRLHLVHPLGFKITDRNLRRAGMDYWFSLDVHEHADWPGFRASARGSAPPLVVHDTSATLLLGRAVSGRRRAGLRQRGSGAPQWLHDELADFRVTIPHANPDLRSFNLSTAAGIATYEALRQVGGPRSPERILG